VFTGSDQEAAPCLYVLKGYYLFYALFNIIPFLSLKLIDNHSHYYFLTSRRALKRRMRWLVG